MENIRIIEEMIDGKLSFIKLGDLLEYYKRDFIVGYEKNRGAHGPNPKDVKKISDSFDVRLFGEVRVSPKEEGLGFETIDGHTRIQAALKADNNKKLSDFAKEQKIRMVIVNRTDFDIQYRGYNTGTPHSAKHYGTNSDTSMGSLIAKIANNNQKLIKKNYQQLGQIGLMLSKYPGIDLNNFSSQNFFRYQSMSAKIGEINKSSNPPELNISNIHLEWLKESVKLALNINSILKSKAKIEVDTERAKLIKKLAEAGAWFGCQLVAGLTTEGTKRPIYGDLSIEELIDRIVYNIENIVPCLKDMARGPLQLAEGAEKISEILIG